MLIARALLKTIFAFLFCVVAASAQTATVPTVTFSFDFPQSDPEHYVITVASDGHASYDSDGKLIFYSEASGVSTKLDFTMSENTRKRIFDLATRAHYFEKDVDTKIKNLADMGKKTLAYKDGEKSTQAVYNYSQIPAVLELTQLFQNLSSTLEYGRRLQHDYRHQKLALDDELRNMEESAKRNELEELTAVAPLLRQIANDSSVMNVSRNRALRLLHVVWLRENIFIKKNSD